MNIHLLTDSLGGPRLNKISKVYFNNTWIDKIIHSFNQHKISYLVRHSLNTNHIVNNQDKYRYLSKKLSKVVSADGMDIIINELIEKE